MSINLKHSNSFSTYVITFTCIECQSLIEITMAYDMVYKWFIVLKDKHNADVIAYVIMPNHLHLILHFNKEDFNLNAIISNGKRFIAYEIINRLEQSGNTELLFRLASMFTEREAKKGQLHKVFESSFDAKAIITHHFLMQKINYILNVL